MSDQPGLSSPFLNGYLVWPHFRAATDVDRWWTPGGWASVTDFSDTYVSTLVTCLVALIVCHPRGRLVPPPGWRLIAAVLVTMSVVPLVATIVVGCTRSGAC